LVLCLQSKLLIFDEDFYYNLSLELPVKLNKQYLKFQLKRLKIICNV